MINQQIKYRINLGQAQCRQTSHVVFYTTACKVPYLGEQDVITIFLYFDSL